MALSPSDLRARLTIGRLPRSASYDPQWMIYNQMGPNVIWLTEALTQVMDLQPGMRVLDMGCGKAISSIFLAREFDVQVWATDLWISASDNWERIREMGEEHRVFPVHAEARALPYADGFFDAAVSMDSYHYYGTDDLYIERYARLVRPGGQLGIVVPGLVQELDGGVPEDLAPYWEWDFCSFHSPSWWQQHWEKSGKVQVERADMVPDGAAQWQLWGEVRDELADQVPSDETRLLQIDAGNRLGFTRLVGRVPTAPG